ncbi:hypothetical protein KPATCC21470_1979 [Kitasatospora purpeofusca]
MRGWSHPSSPSTTSARPAPRACGVGPLAQLRWDTHFGCSPRMRGWSRDQGRGRWVSPLLPAHAGLVPGTVPTLGRLGPAPRACGVGPGGGPVTGLAAVCSPRMRGWSPDLALVDPDHDLLPAHAGLVPESGDTSMDLKPAPRACGVGPPVKGGLWGEADCSPRMRGWSRGAESRRAP